MQQSNTEEKSRPFFSIIIPCYNSKPEHIRTLLSSIEKQYMNEDIEVIISNDRSTDTSFMDTISEFTDLNITCVTVPDYLDDEEHTQLIRCPGNTREVGVSIATGEWITFVDHDDELIPNTFKQIRDEIINQNIEYIASCNFYEVNPYANDEILNEFVHTGNWMHGKFYNLDNFWKAKNFHYKLNLRTHEDIYISSKTICELHRLNMASPVYIELFCLKWKAWDDSTSRLLYAKRGFLEQFFNDYAESTIGYYIDDYIYSINELQDKTEENVYDHLRSCIDVIMHMYFYIQGFHFQRPSDYLLENDVLAKNYIRTVCGLFGIDTDFIYKCVLENNAQWYNNIRKSAMIGSGTFVESCTFYDFLH